MASLRLPARQLQRTYIFNALSKARLRPYATSPQINYRYIHSTQDKLASPTSGHQQAVAADPTALPIDSNGEKLPAVPMQPEEVPSGQLYRPLKEFSTSSLLRALLCHKVSESPLLMKLSSSFLLSNMRALERPGVLKWIVDQTFYKQFCAGSNAKEVQETTAELKNKGIKGVALNYAKEVAVGEEEHISSDKAIKQWEDGCIKAIDYSFEGDFVALKFSGAGKAALDLLLQRHSRLEDDNRVAAAAFNVFEHAQKNNIRIFIDAEQGKLQPTVDAWALDIMKKYNRSPRPLVYNTYQMYRLASPSNLLCHLREASTHKFSLGVKLVRGAYLATEPRQTLCATREKTDLQFNSALKALLRGNFPEANVGLVVATHNHESCELGRSILLENSMNGVNYLTDVCFAQLQGMADELTMKLVHSNLDVYKYVVFGTTAECAKYLLRRAEENKEGAQRSEENRQALYQELRTRLLGFE